MRTAEPLRTVLSLTRMLTFGRTPTVYEADCAPADAPLPMKRHR
jgi:hypothetical protein